MCVYCVCVANGQRVVSVFTVCVCERVCLVNVGVSRSEEVGRSEVGRSVGGRRPKSKNPTQ